MIWPMELTFTENISYAHCDGQEEWATSKYKIWLAEHQNISTDLSWITFALIVKMLQGK
jgi:hypothetical protein